MSSPLDVLPSAPWIEGEGEASSASVGQLLLERQVSQGLKQARVDYTRKINTFCTEAGLSRWAIKIIWNTQLKILSLPGIQHFNRLRGEVRENKNRVWKWSSGQRESNRRTAPKVRTHQRFSSTTWSRDWFHKPSSSSTNMYPVILYTISRLLPDEVIVGQNSIAALEVKWWLKYMSTDLFVLFSTIILQT